MSRGHGYVQRFILEELDREWTRGASWLHARELTERFAHGRGASDVIRSVRRALRLLAADGLVELRPGATVGTREGPAARIARLQDDEVARRLGRRAEARELRRQLRAGIAEPRARVPVAP